MVISRTPLRMSFVGGGSDFPEFYKKHGGCVISTTIDKFVYVAVNPSFDGKWFLHYSETEHVESVDQIKHNIIRETLKFLNITTPLEITSMADVPKGTGLGSSSAFCVGLLNALNAFLNHQGLGVNTMDLASVACHIEIEMCKEPIGVQDQCAAAYGGLCHYFFNRDGSVSRVDFPDGTLKEGDFLLFFTGISRSASSVLKSGNNESQIIEMVNLAGRLSSELRDGNQYAVGRTMLKAWKLKKQANLSTSNGDIDKWYEKAIKAGASGGKLLGAGAGGFLLFSAPPENHESIIEALKPLKKIDFKFWLKGSEIIFRS